MWLVLAIKSGPASRPAQASSVNDLADDLCQCFLQSFEMAAQSIPRSDTLLGLFIGVT